MLWEDFMVQVKRGMVFRVKGCEGVETTMRIMAKTAAGYDTLVTTISDYRNREYRQVMTEALMDSCLRTGYIQAIPQSSAKSA